MTQEDKELLIKDLCARLPYRVKVHLDTGNKAFDTDLVGLPSNNIVNFHNTENYETIEECFIWDIKPYLRPMSSMTEEEVDFDLEDKTTLKGLNAVVEYNPDTHRIQTAEYVTMNDIRFGEHTNKYPPIDHCDMYKTIDWLNSRHFDFRNLIEKGLALEAPEGMY